MSTETPSLADVLEAWRNDHALETFVALPARVESYSTTKQTVVVTPMTKRPSRNADDERLVDTLPTLPDIPVQWLRGGGYSLQMPLVAGDEGLLVFPDTDLGAWRATGVVSDPGDERLHALGGAVFQPGLVSVARVLAGVGHLVLGKDGGPNIHIDGATVQLGAAGGQFVALANLVATQLSALKSAISGAAVVAGDGGAAFKANIMTALGGGWPASTAATLTKAT